MLPMTNEFLSELSSDIGKLLTQEESYDVIIKAGEGNDSREFKAHSLILKARCTYFQSALSNSWARKGDGGIINFNKPNISPAVFEFLLKYLYTAKADFSEQKVTDLLHILVAADELNLQKLINHVEQYLLENKYDFLRKDPIKVLQIVFRHDVCNILKDYCFEAICEEPNILLNSKEFLTLDKSILIILLKRDILSVEEVDVWNNLIKWGKSQINNKEENFANWDKENIYNLREFMQDFIPLIRWFQINSVDFRKNVMPYRKVIPKDLYEDILSYHLDPSYEVNTTLLPPRISQRYGIDSSLIEQKHVIIISSWIDKKESNFYDRKRIPYSFKLLYRASRDGFEATIFHQLCDYKGPTITIAKVRSHDKLIGGYNPLDWKPQPKSCSSRSGDNCWYSSFDSFLFSFASKSSSSSSFSSSSSLPSSSSSSSLSFSNDNSVPKIARIGNSGNVSDYAIGYNASYGPSFGGGWDLSIQDNNLIYSYGPYSYPDCGSFVTKNQHLKLEDYEVFQVVKKKIDYRVS